MDAKKSREEREEEAMLKEMEMIVIEEARKAEEKKQADEKETAEAMRRLGKEFEKGLAEDLKKA